jgi:hypothetical protein
MERARLLAHHDLRAGSLNVPRAQPVLGTRTEGSSICLSPFETTLITGASGGGRSTVHGGNRITRWISALGPGVDYGRAELRIRR